MSEPYRGFVELPKAVFDDIKKMGEAIVEEAVKKAQPAPAPRRVADVATVQYALRRMMRDGFEVWDVVREAGSPDIRVIAKHSCGAMQVKHIDERALVVSDRHGQIEQFAALADSIEEGCYCVRPDPTPNQSALHHALMAARDEKLWPSRILMSADFALSLGRELNAPEPLNGGRYMGVPMAVTYGVDPFELEFA